MTNKTLRILGTRGIPATHGGFEMFAEHLAPYLVDKGWKIYVYCQEQGQGDVYEDHWRGVQLIHVPVADSGSRGSLFFDWYTTKHAAKARDTVLTLGYNTALFCFLYRLKRVTNLINMDGIEWKRQKWSAAMKAWFYINDWLGCLLGNHLIADHPEIGAHLATRVARKKITVIPYGADSVRGTDSGVLAQYGLEPHGYVLLIARPEPENSIAETVRAFSRRQRNKKLVVLGDYDPDNHPYQKSVLVSASSEVQFVGAIFDKEIVQPLREHAALYVHGHQVGGTNPSLVEALGAASPVLAHDNKFNRWVAGPDAAYFSDEPSCAEALDQLLDDADRLQRMRDASRARHAREFTWEKVLGEYESVLAAWSKDR